MTAEAIARRLYDECATQRATDARLEARYPDRVKTERTSDTRSGRVSVWDDPLIRVRASDLEAICGALLEASPSVSPIDPDQLSLLTEEP